MRHAATVMHDAVDPSSMPEGITTEQGLDTIDGEWVGHAATGLHFVQAGRVRVKGKGESVFQTQRGRRSG